MKPYFIVFFLLFAICSVRATSNPNVEKTESGVIVHLPSHAPNSPRKVRLEVYGENIIRVSASPTDGFSTKKSLILCDNPVEKAGIRLERSSNYVELITKRIRAKLSLPHGEISFYDRSGRPIAREQRGGGKSFTPITVEGSHGFSMRQVFESNDREAFYGLGQHQDDDFNYKGKNESLFQYNTKISIPFVLSSENYGILWDNYSLSKFGDVRDYDNLDQFDLFDKYGVPGALTASYLVNGDPQNVFIERRESTIDYENIVTVKNLPSGFPLNKGKVVWEGEILPKETGTYRFMLYYAGYTSVYLDGKEVVPEVWRTAWNPNSYKFDLKMRSGKRHSLKLVWRPDGGSSYVGLKALSPVPDKEQNKLSLWSEMGDQIDYYFIAGNNADEVISGYRQLTGKASILPKWAMGYWQSRERYKTQKELLTVVDEYRKRKIPLDNIVLDWNYWPESEWGSHGFDRKRFPDPKGMVDSVHAMDARLMISVWPKFYATTSHFKEFEKEGWMYMQAVKDSIRDWVGPGYVGSFYDAYAADARKLFWKQMRDSLYTLGIDAWWMDASEPNVRDCTDMPYRKALCGPTALGSSTEYFNAYALMNAMAIYDGQRGEDKDRRVFLLTRSGFAGLQRYATAAWSGDIGTRWEDMKAQISAGLNFSLSGIPYWTMDIGGFSVEKRYEKAKEGSPDMEEWRELNTRWFQFGAFCPLFRSHGQYPFREIYAISPPGSPAYESMVYYTKLRYRLMPYIYSLAGKTYFDDYTLMRAMVMDFGRDYNTHNLGDQYMFGPSLLVCPVYQYGARSRTVYFPKGSNWYDYESNAYIKGGRAVEVDAPYDRIPLYVKAGSIIPIGKDIQSTRESQSQHLTLRVYAGEDASFTLYEDEGTNYNYEKGEYMKIAMLYNHKDGVLTLDDRSGYYEGMPEEREFTVEFVQPNGSLSKVNQIKYKGDRVSIKLVQ